MIENNIETRVSLPADLLAAAEKAIEAGKVTSLEQMIERALRRELAALQQAEIDAALLEMVQDSEYQAEVLQLESEFAGASWEAFQQVALR
ncbi:MAG: CopG family transcriptional regulator [Cyanobacteria bacterium P01_E01_bin.42]